MKIVFWGVYSKRAGKGINRLFLAILLEKEINQQYLNRGAPTSMD